MMCFGYIFPMFLQHIWLIIYITTVVLELLCLRRGTSR